MFSVLFQELFRLLIYLLLDRADTYLKKLTETEETQIFANKHILAYVVGLGFGLMSGAFSLVNVLAASLGPGTLGFNGEPHNFFIVSAVMTLCMVLLHTSWGVIFFSSLDTGMYSLIPVFRHLKHIKSNSGTYWQTGFVIVSHMFVSCLSLLNSYDSGSLYPASIIPSYLVLLVSITLAVKVAGGSIGGIKAAVTGGGGNLEVQAEQ